MKLPSGLILEDDPLSLTLRSGGELAYGYDGMAQVVDSHGNWKRHSDLTKEDRFAIAMKVAEAWRHWAETGEA